MAAFKIRRSCQSITATKPEHCCVLALYKDRRLFVLQCVKHSISRHVNMIVMHVNHNTLTSWESLIPALATVPSAWLC